MIRLFRYDYYVLMSLSFRSADQNAIGCLPLSKIVAISSFKFPTKSRLPHIQTRWIGQIFTGETFRNDGTVGLTKGQKRKKE